MKAEEIKIIKDFFAEEAASYLIIEADFIDAKENASPYEKEQAELKREVAKRIIETYA